MTEEREDESSEERKSQGEENYILENSEDENLENEVNNQGDGRYTEVDNDYLTNPVEFGVNNINSINNQGIEKGKEEEKKLNTEPTEEEKAKAKNENDYLPNPVELNNINSINDQELETGKEEGKKLNTTGPTKEEEKNAEATDKMDFLSDFVVLNKIGEEEEKNAASPSLISNKNTYNLKIILLGEINVGKSSIIRRYLDNKFNEEAGCSLGCESKMKKLDIDQENEAVLQIWDTAGEEKFNSVTKQYYNDSNGVMVVYDITKEDSFKKLEKWIKYINNYAPKGVTIMIIGNKTDLINEKVELGKKLNTIKRKYLYYDVSAKSGTNIYLAFETLAMTIIENMKNQKDRDNEHESFSFKLNKFKQKLKNCHC